MCMFCVRAIFACERFYMSFFFHLVLLCINLHQIDKKFIIILTTIRDEQQCHLSTKMAIRYAERLILNRKLIGRNVLVLPLVLALALG